MNLFQTPPSQLLVLFIGQDVGNNSVLHSSYLLLKFKPFLRDDLRDLLVHALFSPYEEQGDNAAINYALLSHGGKKGTQKIKGVKKD